MPPLAYRRALARRLTVLTGGLGSGKSEFAIVWAGRLAVAGRGPVLLADLDEFKPRFRSEEAERALHGMGVRLRLAPPSSGDAPAVPGEVIAALEAGQSWMVLDAGAEATGTRVLRDLRPHLEGREHNLLYVLNTRRPHGADPDWVRSQLSRVEAETGLPVNGLVASPHVMGETTSTVVAEGLAVARQVASRTGVPLLGVMVLLSLAERLTIPDDLELFPLYRMLRPRAIDEEHELVSVSG